MPNLKKSSGFKMSGYSYPGQSPMKGARKKADQAAAKAGQDEAMAKMEEFGDMKMKSTDLLAKGSFKVDAGSSPATKRSPAKNLGSSIMDGLKEGAKEFATTAVAEGGKAVVGAIGKKKEKPKKVAADQSGFAGIQFGKK